MTDTILKGGQEASLGALTLGAPVAEDAADLAALIATSPPLEPNTTYAYLLFCTHFADTCVVARDDAGIVGTIVGYCPPTNPDAVFVWQIAVHSRGRGQGLGLRMLESLANRVQARGVKKLWATVAPSNEASDRLFRRFARERGIDLERSDYFSEALFGAATHEPEYLYQIGLSTAKKPEEP